MSKLKNMLSKKLEAWVEFPGVQGFEVKLVYLTREELSALRNKCVSYTVKAGFREKVENFDSERFTVELVKAAIIDWKGLTVAGLSKFAPVSVETEEEGAEEVAFTQEDAVALLKASTIFDNWLNEAMFDLDSFRKK